MAHYDDQRERDYLENKELQPLQPSFKPREVRQVKEQDQLFEVPQGETVVGICNFNGMVIVATSKKVYKLVEDILIPIQFQTANDFIRVKTDKEIGV